MTTSKSFRDIKNVAPYGKPKTKITSGKANRSRKVSIFNTVKTLINKSFDSLTSGNEECDKPEQDIKTNVSMVPGGFFEEGNRSIHNNNNSNNNKNGDDDSMIASSQTDQNDNNETDGDVSMANISNIKLANFFRQKGDNPLTDIEMEGVMSLMRKSSMPQLPSHNHNHHDMANSTFTSLNPTEENVSFDTSSNNNKVFKSSRILSTSSNANTTNHNNTASGFKVPQFMPKYDSSNNTMGSRISSINSTTSTRRVFDYSGMKSPYRKTVIFKYPSHRRSVSTPHPQITKPIAKSSQTKKNSNGQRMTNVASALVTLLENNNSNNNNNNNTIISSLNTSNDNKEQDKSRTITEESKSLANPYSSIIRKPQQLHQLVPLEKKAEREPVTKQSDDVVPPAAPVVSSANITISSTYKPARSSSLRSNVVVADIGEAKEPKKEDTEEKGETQPKPIVAQNSSFAFTFGNKDTSKDEKKSEEEIKSSFSIASRKDTPAVKAAPLFSIPIPKKNNDNEKEIKKEEKENNNDDGVTINNTTITPSKYNFEFETPAKSGIDASQIDDSKMNQFKSMFVF
ncbi:nucleoporin Nup60p [Monosporozyma servazzii]